MNTKRFSIPLSRTAAVVGLIACAVSCAKKNNDPVPSQPASPEPVVTNTVADAATNSVAGTNAVAPAEPAVTVTNVPPATTAATDITNPPPAETTTVKPPEAATVLETNVPGHAMVVEMPPAAPSAPTNFFPASVTTNAATACCMAPVECESSTNFYVALRAGYEHINHGDNNDAYTVGVKLFAFGDGLREAAGKNAWLIPDAAAEISSQYLAKTDNNPHPGSDNGLRFRADFTWPWVHWTTLLFDRANSVCPFCQPIAFRLGPTVNVGFDHLYNEADYRFARYAGVRLSFNRTGFVEYTAGETEGLDGTRQQIVAEIPFYESRNGEVRYYLRGLWNHGANRQDILEGGLFLEMPFSTLVSPGKWGDLVPFAQ